MRVTFYTLGCKVNQNETGALAQLFEENGYTVVSNEEGADVYIVNSCTVTNFGDQKSRKWLRRAKRENPGAVTVLTGATRRPSRTRPLRSRGGRCDRLWQPSRDFDRRAEGAER